MLPSVSAAFAEAPVPIAVVSLAHRQLSEVLLVNRAMADLLNSAAAEITGRLLGDLMHPDDRTLLDLPADTLADPMEHMTVRMVRNGWGVVWTSLSVAVQQDGDREPSTAVVVLQDVTAWRRIEEELAHRATHDTLTGLANRSLLLDQLDRAMARLSRRSGTVAVLFCDLDGFKSLNDTFGHRIGDAVLQEAAGRILNSVRREDLVVRMGGDEFVIVCESSDRSEAGRVAERVRDALDAPLRVQQRDFTVTGSIGVAQVSDGTADPEDLVRRADLAMYQAKQSGRNRVVFFAKEMEDRARSRVEIVEQVRTALAHDQVTIAVQPIIALASGDWVGSEALARIERPGRAPLHPDEVLPIGAKSGLLDQLDTRVRAQALAWLADRRGAGSTAPIWVSINVTAHELATIRFATAVEKDLAAVGLLPEHLTIEVSEAAMVDVAGPAQVTLRRLRALGCRIAIDDFGSGSSSLMSLRDLPADLVKIDRSFVAGLGHDDHDEAIVSAMISVSQRLGRLVVAEGVERPLQAEVLQAMGCDYAQGYLFGPPTPAASAPRLER